MWTQLWIGLGLASVAVAVCVAAPVAEVVVAPAGDDQARGWPEAPFATLARAQAAARDLQQSEPARTTPLRILLRAGTYYLEDPLVLTPRDSGSPAAPVIWSAAPGESVTISGGRRLTGWQKQADGRWQLQLPAVASGEWDFSQLFVNGQRRYRPRLPKQGYYFIEKELPPTQEGKGYDRFGFRSGDIAPDWHDLSNVEALCFHFWGMSRLRLATVDGEQRIVTCTGPTCSNAWWQSLRKGHRYLLENVREALSEPGEWYLDRASGLLTYIPLPGEDPDSAVVVAPRLDRLLELRGDAGLGLWVDNLCFEGLTLAHTNWILPPAGYSYGQAEVALRGAVRATGARRIVIDHCIVTQIGTYAIDFGAGCSENRIENCELFDLGAGGVRLGEGWNPPPGATPASHNLVRNNLIAHGGRTHPAAIGVWVGLASDNTIADNDIFDFYYSGLSVGWTWGYGPTPANRNLIENNHVHQIGQGVLSDMGGIYTLGLSPGTVIRHNSFHDIESFDYGGWGIYFDEGSSEIVAEDNLVYRTKTGGFHQHYGKGNTVRNNIFVSARVGQIQRTRDETHLGFTFEQNLVYWTEGPLLHGNWNSPGYAMDRNLFWNAAGEPVSFAGKTIAQWQESGFDRDSVIADPRFVDPQHDDYRLQPDSPALALGFRPFDLTTFGRRTASSAAATAPFPRAFPPPPPPPPPAPIEEDFEALAVGSACPGATTCEDETVREAMARVSDEQAASGKHSLKFVDRPGQKYPWNPHVFFDPSFNGGAAEGRFALRFEGGTQFYHEWRDASSPYLVGPSLRVRLDGALTVDGKELLKLPLGQWVRVEVAWGMTEELAGRFTLVVTVPGNAPMRFPDLPCNPRCRSLRWVGFCAEGNDAGGFFLDDIVLRPVPAADAAR